MSSEFFNKWDYELILTFKRYSGDNKELERSFDIWCKHCAVPREHINASYIVHRLSQIVEYLYKETNNWIYSTISILEESAPSKDWMYPLIKSDSGEDAYWERLFYTYASILRHTESKHLPGLDEYFNNVWLKEGKP